ncbi:MAG: NUDIX domain-containing protein [Acidobacteria bacterium]|nr:NUDIX domain-containing protein [Acidobacteriota bacterium]
MGKEFILKDVVISDLGGVEYIQLKRMDYTLNGRRRRWNIAVMHDSIAVLLYEIDTHSFILVKQFRPPVYLHNGDGFTYELCAGLVDKELPLAEIAREEIREETGYEIALTDLREVTSFYTSVGKSGARQYLYYAEVTGRQRRSAGGGVENEDIEVIKLPQERIWNFLYDESKAKTPGLMFAFLWWWQRYGDEASSRPESAGSPPP